MNMKCDDDDDDGVKKYSFAGISLLQFHAYFPFFFYVVYVEF